MGSDPITQSAFPPLRLVNAGTLGTKLPIDELLGDKP